VFSDSLAHLVGQIEPLAAFFQKIHHAQALLDVMKTTRDQAIEHGLAGMTKRRVTQIVAREMASLRSSFRRRARVMVRAI